MPFRRGLPIRTTGCDVGIVFSYQRSLTVAARKRALQKKSEPPPSKLIPTSVEFGCKNARRLGRAAPGVLLLLGAIYLKLAWILVSLVSVSVQV